MNKMQNILKKVIEILINPKKGWANLTNYCDRDLIDLKEIDKYKPIYFLIPIFAMIPALAHFLGMTVFKDLYFSEEILKLNQQQNNNEALIYLKQLLNENDIVKISIRAFIYYIFEMLRPFIFAVIIFFLASAFGGTRNPYRALAVAVISLIPFWVGSITYIFFAGKYSIITAIVMFVASFYTLYITYTSGRNFLCIEDDVNNTKSFQFIIVVAILFLIINGIFGIFIENIFMKFLI